MLSDKLDSLHETLCRAAQSGDMPAKQVWHAALIVAALADDARRLEGAAVPHRVRALPDDAGPNVVRFDTAGAIQSRRNLLACALWPAAVMLPMAAAVLMGVGL